MKKNVFSFIATVLCIAGLMSFVPVDQQDTPQQKKRTEQQRKDRDRDTMSNRRMHDHKAPPTIDSLPERVPVVPLPDTINKNIH